MCRLIWSLGGLGILHGLGHGHVQINMCISNQLEEEQKLNTHLIGEATFLFSTYPLFIVRHVSPLNGQREREVEIE
jgi:hypothetical protein